MGIGPANLTAYLWWHAEGWLKPGASMLDIGAQELFCEADPAAVNRFIATFGGAPYPDDELIRVANRGLAGTAMKRAGLQYASIDCKPYPFGIMLDLNRDRLPPEHRGRYDAVTNHGTSEHILNQWNVFEAMHDAAKPGAMMYHAVPFCGEFEHGIINYNPKFFWALIEANGYQKIEMCIAAGGEAILPESFSAGLDVLHAGPGGFKASAGWLVVTMRKTDDRPFAGLSDPAFK